MNSSLIYRKILLALVTIKWGLMVLRLRHMVTVYVILYTLNTALAVH